MKKCKLLSEAYVKLNQSQIVKTKMGINLTENISSLQMLESGDKFHLHDPLYKEVNSFIKNNTANDINTVVQNGKNKGLRCAYVEVLKDDNYLGELIAFNTIDQGLVYFDVLNYRVSPVIGKSFTDCVEGNPYIHSDAKIVRLRIIW